MRVIAAGTGRRGSAARVQALLADLDAGGVGSGLVLVIGLPPPAGSRSTVVSVGPDGSGVPGVRPLGGGRRTTARLLDEQLRRRRHRRVPEVDLDPAWTVVVTGEPPERRRVEEALLTIGSGGIGTRGALGRDGKPTPSVLAAGVYTDSGAEQHLLAGPEWTGLQRPVSVGPHRVLDLRSGVLLGVGDGAGPPVRTVRFASAARPGVVALRAEGVPAQLRPGPPLLPPPGTALRRGASTDWLCVPSTASGGIGALARQLVGTHGGVRTVERTVAVVADAYRPPDRARARRMLAAVQRGGFDRELAAHRHTWSRRWAVANVDIPNDPDLQLALRYALYALWSNVADRGEAAVGARGVSGPGYAGHVFWDADVFVLPAVLTLSPAMARAMLEYRVRRLPAARRLAAACGRSGARFPWESALDGTDVTPTEGRLAGRPIRIRTGELEEHVVSDVAWAAHRYALWTGDHAFLSGRGRGLLVETARYWAARCRLDASGRAHIDGVIGPDEYHTDVDDNAYTNLLARWHLRRAAEVLVATGGDPAEARRWRRLAAALVDGFDPATGRHEQFAGYFTLDPATLADRGLQAPIAADLLLRPEQLARTQITKQPDVLMAHHLLGPDLPAGSLVADLDHYVPRTAHGSSLSPAITAGLLARAGRPDDALGLFRLAAHLDLDDLTAMTGAGLHLATLGGVWQALLGGFCGIDVDGRGLLVDPHLPSAWDEVRVRFQVLGVPVRVLARHDRVVVETAAPLAVRVAGARRTVVTGVREFPVLVDAGKERAS